MPWAHVNTIDKMLNKFLEYVGKVALVNDNLGNLVVNTSLATQIAGSTGNIFMHGNNLPTDRRIIDITWGSITTQGTKREAKTTNVHHTNPLMWSIQGAVAGPTKIVLLSETGGDIVRAVITPTSFPSYASGDGAYYLRNIAVRL